LTSVGFCGYIFFSVRFRTACFYTDETLCSGSSQQLFSPGRSGVQTEVTRFRHAESSVSGREKNCAIAAT
ncbi:hypothetical protein BaRGS_00016474, partial [Batillaria attramentaria]